MADTAAMQKLQGSCGDRICEAAFALGESWPPPCVRLEDLAQWLREAQLEAQTRGLVSTLEDVEELLRFVEQTHSSQHEGPQEDIEAATAPDPVIEDADDDEPF